MGASQQFPAGVMVRRCAAAMPPTRHKGLLEVRKLEKPGGGEVTSHRLALGGGEGGYPIYRRHQRRVNPFWYNYL